MKVISFSAIKGGVGKTTIAYNFAEYLAKQGQRVLLIDLDHQLDLTSLYGVKDTLTNVSTIFLEQGKPTIHKVKDNIGLLAGSSILDDVDYLIQRKSNRDDLLYWWFADHIEEIESDYDIAIIDCRPEFSTIVKNAVNVSDYLIKPLTPSKFGDETKDNLEARLEEHKNRNTNKLTKETTVKAEIIYIANMTKKSAKSTQEFEERNNDVVATFPYRELFNKSTLSSKPTFELTGEDKKLQQAVEEAFDKLWKRIEV